MDTRVVWALGGFAAANAVFAIAYFEVPAIVGATERSLLFTEPATGLNAPATSPMGNCTGQHQARPNLSTADLLASDFEVKAAVPGGVWLQRKKDVFYCNSGVTKDDETMCWKLARPVRGQDCTVARNSVTARDIRG